MRDGPGQSPVVYHLADRARTGIPGLSGRPGHHKVKVIASSRLMTSTGQRSHWSRQADLLSGLPWVITCLSDWPLNDLYVTSCDTHKGHRVITRPGRQYWSIKSLQIWPLLTRFRVTKLIYLHRSQCHSMGAVMFQKLLNWNVFWNNVNSLLGILIDICLFTRT